MLKLSVLKCACVGVLLVSCGDKGNKTQVVNKFQVTQPIPADTTYFVDYVSEINSVKNVEIRARVKGYLEQIMVDEGQTVRRGQPLFRISSQEYTMELLKAKALHKSTLAEAKAAELVLQNTKMLVEKKVVSNTEMEMAQAKLDALNAKIEEAESQQNSAQLKLSYTEIRAPFDGIIDRIPNKVGSLIDEGTLMTSISDNSQVFAYFNVSEKEYLEFISTAKETATKPEVSLILANNKEHSHKGIVETIEGEFDESTGSIAFRARFPNPNKVLKHGSSGRIRLTKKITEGVMITQKSAFEIQDQIYVYVVGADNKVSMKSFTPKLRIPHLYIAEGGLSTSDKIIYEGLQNVKVGMQVEAELIPMQQIISGLGK
ncbi:MAG TPA: efflux RND transporter periplasmic adaptor subunit [Cytophagales bacterium]|nr:efflux RND transporter periplasmic adaptor subunit [Cytophagales bacterium]